MTPEQFLALPDEKPYLEYVDGVVVQKPMANLAHGRLTIRLGVLLTAWIGDGSGVVGSEVRSRLGELPNFRLPDLSYWAPGRIAEDDSLPTLAVEVLSPSQTMGELREKCRFFRRNGVDVCWLIDPVTRAVEIFEGDRDAEPIPAEGVLSSAYLPGFELPLATLFAILT